MLMWARNVNTVGNVPETRGMALQAYYRIYQRLHDDATLKFKTIQLYFGSPQ